MNFRAPAPGDDRAGVDADPYLEREAVSVATGTRPRSW
jgi:hypothetical protein